MSQSNLVRQNMIALSMLCFWIAWTTYSPFKIFTASDKVSEKNCYKYSTYLKIWMLDCTKSLILNLLHWLVLNFDSKLGSTIVRFLYLYFNLTTTRWELRYLRILYLVQCCRQHELHQSVHTSSSAAKRYPFEGPL